MNLQLCSETKNQSSWGFKGSLFLSFHLCSDTRRITSRSQPVQCFIAKCLILLNENEYFEEIQAIIESSALYLVTDRSLP
jgi:hypothetical protein